MIRLWHRLQQIVWNAIWIILWFTVWTVSYTHLIQKMEFYRPEELQIIVERSAGVLGVEIEPEGAAAIARRSRGTPRLANRLLKRVRDFAQVKYDGVITKQVADFALDILDVDKLGLDNNDRNIRCV